MDYWLNLCSLVQILFYMVDAGRTSKVVVKTNIGPIQGFKVLAGSSEVAVFRGIPYAEAPVGNRRFKPPVPVSKWNKVLITSDYGKICIQSSSSTDNQTYVGDEDCLTLNIFKPMLFKKENKNIPVIVMIHTGNFISGSSKDVNGVELAKSLESIVVTLNYRLGIFGFYSMDGHIKENIGVLDQITALKWIKSNIQDFNGNPENILMIADQITSSIHLMSPISRILFSRAISYDGESYLNPISSHNFNFEKHRSHLEKICGTINNNGHLPVEHIVWVCLRKLSAVDLVDLSRDLVDHVLWHPFRPVYDDDVISADSHIHSSFLHCDYMAFKSNLLLPALLNRNENNTSCEDIFKFAISDIAGKRFSNNKQLVETILMSNYFPQFSKSSYDFCKAIEPLMNDAITSDIISFANHHSRTGLTFVNFASIGNHAHASTFRRHRIKSRDIACILTNQHADSCHLPGPESVGINNIVRTFLYHGYPTVNPETVWRPYTTTSKNYLQTTNTTFVTGDSANWPLEKMERLWLDVLPDVGTSKSFASEPDIKVIKQSVGLSWGLTEQQLEALVFSLILSCLVLLCVTLTLFRIICFVNGKTFYSKEKKTKRKGILLTKTKKRTEPSGSAFNCEVFNIQDSINLDRRTSDHADIDA